MRLSLAPLATVLAESPSSYSRFVYETGGTLAVYLATVMSIVTFIASWLRPIATLFLMLVLYGSIFVYKLILRKSSKNLSGMLMMTVFLCLANALYSVLLKLSLNLPATGLPPSVCLIFSILLQVVYMIGLLWITITAVVGWRDLGFANFSSVALSIKDKITFEGMFDRLKDKTDSSGPDKKEEEVGWGRLREMLEADNNRRSQLKGTESGI
jgi:hypothetical protein